MARPRSSLGWLLLGAGLATLVGSATSEYYKYALLVGGPGAEWTGWVGTWAWDLGAGVAVGLALLLFPDGRLPAPGWTPVLGLAVLAVAVNTALQALAPGPLDGEFRLLDNPLSLGERLPLPWETLRGEPGCCWPAWRPFRRWP